MSILQERKKDLVILLIMLGILAAIAISVSVPQNKKAQKLLKKIDKLTPSIKEVSKKAPPPLKEVVKLKIQRGDTITQVLQKGGIGNSDAHQLINQLKPTYNLARIHPGREITLTKEANQVVTLRYDISMSSYLISEKKEQGIYSSKIVNIPYSIKTAIVSGEIDNSLFGAITRKGEKPELADSMAKLYEYDIDFNRDIRRGDKFRVIIEKLYLKGEFAGYRNILASEFINRNKSYKIVRYTASDGTTSYYHPDGRAVKKFFLRCPLPFMRVTSRYGNRKHPVMGFSAKHNGVDFGAPVGTTVRASASGTVAQKGYHRIRGKYIILRHPNRYHTHYYHLSRFKASLRVGSKVSQGDIIGKVGATGRVTGAHLHYGMKKNNRFINPLTLKSPSVKPINPNEIDQFKHYSSSLFSILSDRDISIEFDKLYLPEIPSFMNNSLSEQGIKFFIKNSLH